MAALPPAGQMAPATRRASRRNEQPTLGFAPAGVRQVHPHLAARTEPMTMRKLPFPVILIACNLLLIGGFAISA